MKLEWGDKSRCKQGFELGSVAQNSRFSVELQTTLRNYKIFFIVTNFIIQQQYRYYFGQAHSTVTLLAKFLGLSTSRPRCTAVW